MINITLKDGSVRQYSKGTTVPVSYTHLYRKAEIRTYLFRVT